MNVVNLVLAFLQANWIWLVLIVLAVVFLWLLWIKNKAIVLMLARRAVMVAEEHLGSGTGQAKKAEAIAWVYVQLPLLLKLIFTEKVLGDIIEYAVEWLHEQFVDGELADRLGVKLPTIPTIEGN